MSFKIVLISIGSVIAIGGVTAGALYIYSNSQKIPVQVAVDKPVVTSAELNKDPCTLFEVGALASIFGSAARDIQPGVASKKTGLNGEASEECDYSFTTDKSKANTLSMQTYLYKPGEEVPGLDWNNIDKTVLPTYFKESDSVDGKTHDYVMHSINGPTNYLYVISQPKDQTTFDKTSAISVLRDISNKAKYAAQ